jgi:dTDP-4-dehydrorhamnose reductase
LPRPCETPVDDAPGRSSARERPEQARLKVLITGGSGLLALNWACAIRGRHEVILGTHHRRVALAGTTAIALPLEEPQELADALRQQSPDVVIHTAGITSVEDCERDASLAEHVNAGLALNVAAAAAGAGARLIHVSTDHLFSGTNSLYTEDAAAQPVNAYARSKLLAEEWVAGACPEALIVRTNFFGWGHRYRRSFSDWIYYSLSAGEELTMFDDVFITPILADELAAFSHRLLDLGASGIYNVVGDERLSKYDFASRLADAYGFPKTLLRHGKIAASPLFARRPPDMSLDNRKARERLGTSLGTIAEYLLALQHHDRAGRRGELLAAITE